jgi:Domain of unknown function (DUF4387)
MATLFDLCSLIRSKNAGPFVLTFDVMFSDRGNYERAKRSRPLTKRLLGEIYRQREEDITLVYHDHALAIKASMPRPIFQGELQDGDCYGGQQYVPLLQIEVA